MIYDSMVFHYLGTVLDPLAKKQPKWQSPYPISSRIKREIILLKKIEDGSKNLCLRSSMVRALWKPSLQGN